MINGLLARTEHLSKDEMQKYITVIIDKRELVFLAEVAMDSKAIFKGGRIYLPLRQVMAAFGYDIEWYGNSRTIHNHLRY